MEVDDDEHESHCHEDIFAPLSDASEDVTDDHMSDSEDEFVHIGRERLTKQQWEVEAISQRRPVNAKHTSYLFLTKWKGVEAKTWEPWAVFSEATKQWYRDQKPPKSDPDKYHRIYEQEERRLKQQQTPAQSSLGKFSPKSRRLHFRTLKQRAPNAFRHKQGQKSPTSNKKASSKKKPPVELHVPDETEAETRALQALLAKLDTDFQTQTDAARVTFLEPANWQTVKQAVEKYRELTSEPHCDRAACCVCDEMNWRRELHVYAISESDEARRCRIDLLPDHIKATMIAELKGDKRYQIGAWRQNKHFAAFKHCLLSSAGMDEQRGWINVCSSCDAELNGGNLPKFAIANNLFFGATPAELQSLTWAEQQLLATNRVHLNILHLEAEDVVNKRTPRLFRVPGVKKKNTTNKVLKLGKCNAICLPHHAAKLMRVLPERSNELNHFIRVVFTKADGKLPEPLKLKWILYTRREVLRKALKWLQEHNHLYKEVETSEANLNTFPEDGIPAPFWDSIRVNADTDAAKADGAGYAASVHDEADSDGEDNEEDEDDELDNREKVLGKIHHRGLIDANAKFETVQELSRRAQESLESDNKVLKAPEGAPGSLFNNPKLYLGAFPELYPLGVGGPQCKRKKRLSLEEYARHVLLLSDNRFRQHAIWPFFILNTLQIQRARDAAFQSMRLNRFLTHSEHRKWLTPDNIRAALKQVNAADRRGQKPRLHHIKDPQQREALRRVLKDINTIGRQLPLTSAAKYQARCEIQALMARYGIMDLFITINPNDTHAPLMCKLAGEQVKIGLNDPDVPEGKFSNDQGGGLPSAKLRKRLLAMDPLAAVQYSHIVMDAFLRAIVGYDPATGQRSGIFGKVAAYHFNPEEQGRGSLHYHGMLILDTHLSRKELLQELKKPEFQQRVLRYLDDIIANQPPALCTSGPFAKHKYQSPVLERDEIVCESKLCGGDKCGKTHFDGSNCMAPSISYNRRSDHVCFSRIAQPGNDEKQFWHRIGAELDKIVPAVQTHGEQHNRSCVHWRDKKKRAKSRFGKDLPDYIYQEWKKPGFKCRYKFGKCIVCKSAITKNGSVELERQHHWTNSYNALISACLRCNHDIQTTWGTDLQAQGAAIYMTNYATKQQQHLHNLLPLLETAVKTIDARSKQPLSTPSAQQPAKQSTRGPQFSAEEKANQKFLNQVFNQLQKNSELSAHTVIANLIALPPRYTSHEFKPLLLTELLNWAEMSDVERGYQSADPDARRVNNGETFQLAKSKGKVSATNLRLNYTSRPRGLEACSLYDWAAGAEIVKRPTAKRKANWPIFPLLPSHKDAATHGVRFEPDRWVPKVFVKPLPIRDKHPERFAKLILLRFKPFRDIAQLRPDGSTWQEALAEFEASCSSRVKRLIANLESLRDSEDAHVADYQRQLNELHSEMKSQRQQPFEPEDKAAVDDLSDLVQPPDDVELEQQLPDDDLSELIFDHPSDDGTMIEAVDNMARMEAYPNAKARSRGLKQYVDFDYGDEESKLDMETSRAELHQMLKAAASGEIESLEDKHYTNRSDAPADPQMENLPGATAADRIERELSLNPKQRLAFRIITQRLQQELANEQRSPKKQLPVEQLKMYISGVGGTGKSHVIKAVREWCRVNSREEWLQTAAFTGSAATLIGGRTLNSLLGIPRKVAEVRDVKLQRRGRVEQALAKVKLLVIDEVSLIKCDMAAAINFSLRQAKGVMSKPNPPDWGGMHIVFLGDHYQLPPVRGKSKELYNAKNATLKSRDFAWTRDGRLLWERIDTHLQFTEQMRQSDEDYLRMLMNLRTGSCDKQDYQLLQSCVLKNKLPKEWHDVPIGVCSNPVRAQLGLDHVLAQGRSQGKTVLIARAEDRGQRNKGLYDIQLPVKEEKALRKLADHQTQSLPGLLPLLPGAKYVLRKNEPNGAEFGFVNGAECILKSIKLHELEPPIPDDGREVHFLKYVPQAVWMEFPKSTMPKPLTGQTNRKLIPIEPLTEKSLTAKFGHFERTFSRHQLPISPARAITAYACQGRTMDKGFIVDLNFNFSHHDSRSVYVLLSRVKCRHALRIMSTFKPDRLQAKPPKALLEEETRLKLLEQLTFQRNAELWRTIEASKTVTRKKPSECQLCAQTGGSNDKLPATCSEPQKMPEPSPQPDASAGPIAMDTSSEEKHAVPTARAKECAKQPPAKELRRARGKRQPAKAPPQRIAAVDWLDPLEVLQQQRSDCGLYAHYFADVLLTNEAEVALHLHQPRNELKLPDLLERKRFTKKCENKYRGALGGGPIKIVGQNLLDSKLRSLGTIGVNEERPIVINSIVAAHSLLNQGRPSEDTRRLKTRIIDNKQLGVAIVNTTRSMTQGTHWIAIGLKWFGGNKFRAVIADSLNPLDNSDHKWVTRELSQLLYRFAKLDKSGRTTTLHALHEVKQRHAAQLILRVQVETAAKGALPQFSECQSTWTRLLEAVKRGENVLWGQDIGQPTVQRMMASWQALFKQGSTLSEQTVSVFLAHLHSDDRLKVARLCVWPPMRRALSQTLSKLHGVDVERVNTAVDELFQRDVSQLTEADTQTMFLKVLDSAKAVREHLLQNWLSERDS